MSEATTERTNDGVGLKPEPAPTENSGWVRFHGKLVLLQLAVNYQAVKFPNFPARLKDVQPPGTYDPTDAEALAASPVLPGVLFIEPSGDGGIVLILETAAPPDGKDKATIAIHPGNVNYCTMVERSLIERM